MKLKWLKLKAGKKAYSFISQNGLSQSHAKIWAGAAGGPKWIILSELDKYLTQYYFNESKHDMHFIGGSIGAWRAACYTVDDAHLAISGLQSAYINQRYDREIPNPAEVSAKIKEIISQSIGANGIQRLLHPKNKYLHVMTSGMHFNTTGDSDMLIKMKFAWLATNYMLYRKSLNRFATRKVFSNHDKTIIHPDGINSSHQLFNKTTLPKALAGSGSIPMMMDAIVIEKQEHRDGGLVDYHLDLKYKIDDGIVFYPHFYPFIKPGWFDKFNVYRKSKYHENTLLLYPSEALIKRLPNQKLSEIKDFYTYSKNPDQRIDIWNKVADLGKYLVDDFSQIIENQNKLMENLKQWD